MVETMNFGYSSLGVAAADDRLLSRDFSPGVGWTKLLCLYVGLRLEHGVLTDISHKAHAWRCIAVVCQCVCVCVCVC